MQELAGRTRRGGRTAHTREAVHAATRALIASSGVANVTITAVAKRSGVHPTTIYRRWQTCEALLLDVMIEDVADEFPVRVTGDLRGDVIAYLRSLTNVLAQPGGLAVFHAFLATAASHPGRIEAARKFIAPRSAQFQAMLHASDSAELRVDDVLDLVLAPVFTWAALGALTDKLPIDRETALERIADNVIAVREYRRGAVRRL